MKVGRHEIRNRRRRRDGMGVARYEIAAAVPYLSTALVHAWACCRVACLRTTAAHALAHLRKDRIVVARHEINPWR